MSQFAKDERAAAPRAKSFFERRKFLSINSKIIPPAHQKRLTPPPRRIVKKVANEIADDHNPIDGENIEVALRRKECCDDGDHRPFNHGKRKKKEISILLKQ